MFPVINYLFATEGRKIPTCEGRKTPTCEVLLNSLMPMNCKTFGYLKIVVKVSSLIFVDSWKGLSFSYQIKDKIIPSAFI